jgi:MFS transporter, DHA2 family, multidrug resistance protein
MAAFGFACFAGAFYYTSTHFTLTMTFGFASWLRILQMFAIPFAFIAITTAAYVGLPKEASNQVSGIINFVRNVGGSIFIAVTGAIVTNRSLFHQARLQESMQPGNPAFVKQVNALTSYFGGSGKGPDRGSWHKLLFISNSISRLLRRLIRTSTVCSVGWQWAWWCAPSF